ncbi:hypothetical protein [Hyphobacterium sp.]|uniref:hypothetical protein n=1 Tax=Hyphobacterium sp. TaxID=2004662 RepID=UPI003BABC3BF
MKKLFESFLDSMFNHTWRHTFESGESEAERKAWLASTLAMAGDAGITLVHHEIEDGYDFGFPEESHWQAFALNVTAEAESAGSTGVHGHTQEFICPIIQGYWTELAGGVLSQLGVEYKVETNGLESQFVFQSMADRILFTQMIETLDHGADMIDRAHSFRERFGETAARRELDKFEPLGTA